jgi:GNAT superfamily N-acetyltransferase
MADAVEANLFALFRQLAGWSRIEIHDDADCFWTISDLPYPLFNSVLRAQAHDRVEPLIEARIAACLARHVPMLWWTGPSTQPDDLGDRLTQRGFLFEPAHGMAVDLEREAGTFREAAANSVGSAPARTAKGEPEIAIERVEDAPALKTWSRVLCNAFGAPQPFGNAFGELAMAIGLGTASPFRHFLARYEGEPVATCSLFFGAGVAGIYDVSTVPERRRRGIGRTITAAAMNEARALGYRTAILHSSLLGAGIYRSLGFKDICDIGQYVWVPEHVAR